MWLPLRAGWSVLAVGRRPQFSPLGPLHGAAQVTSQHKVWLPPKTVIQGNKEEPVMPASASPQKSFNAFPLYAIGYTV